MVAPTVALVALRGANARARVALAAITLVLAMATGCAEVQIHDNDCRVTAVDKPKVVSLGTFPRYPVEARRKGATGRVRLFLTIDENGDVTGARFERLLGSGLDEAALAAARTMKFRPGTRCGEPVTSEFILAVRFLDSPAPDDAEFADQQLR